MDAGTPHGEWPSPIEASDVAADSLDLSEVAVADGTVYWLERRPEDGGRGVVCRADPDGEVVDVTPEDVHVRTTVHEYGGGDFTVVDGAIIYSRFEDGRLGHIPVDGGEETLLTPEPPEPQAHRFADIEGTPGGERCYAVRERHDVDGEPVNDLVTFASDGTEPPRAVASGHDFYSTPRVDPAGNYLAWLTWDHPHMPWDGTELHIASIGPDGDLEDRQTVMGGPSEAVFQPCWGSDGTLYAVSDRTGWWNVYHLGHPDGDLDPTCIHEADAEYGAPGWAFGSATLAPLDDGRIVAIRNGEGRQSLQLLDPDDGVVAEPDLPYEAYFHPKLKSDGETVGVIGAGPATPPTVVEWTPGEDPRERRQAFDLDLAAGYVSDPEHVAYPTGSDGEATAYGFYYPPANPDADAPADEDPPLIVKVHGGPTSQTVPIADLEKLYYTSRGFAVMDVNYRGSTGYGRSFREALDGEWGVVDTQDCVSAAQYLAETGRADPDRLAITGGSAGGYATLCALAFHDTFDAGASFYGVADLRALAEHTHKFESRYLDGLVGPLPEAEDVYDARSPVSHAEGITEPLLVLQGGEDRVVPVEQAEQLVDALVEQGTPYAYLEFPEERHGFRSAASRTIALETVLGFWGSVFGFDPDGVAPLKLDRGDYRKRTPSGPATHE